MSTAVPLHSPLDIFGMLESLDVDPLPPEPARAPYCKVALEAQDHRGMRLEGIGEDDESFFCPSCGHDILLARLILQVDNVGSNRFSRFLRSKYVLLDSYFLVASHFDTGEFGCILCENTPTFINKAELRGPLTDSYFKGTVRV